MKLLRLCKRCKKSKSVMSFSTGQTRICKTCVSYAKYRKSSYTPLQRKTRNQLHKQLIKAVKDKKFRFDERFEEVIGINAEGFRKHIEEKFQPGMNWYNYGKPESCLDFNKWELDHIIPLSTFQTVADIRKLYNYKNIQPLWCILNSKKSNKSQEQLKKEAEEREQRKNS